MAAISVDVMVDQLLAVLREAFEGSKQQWSYFTDGPADTALLGTLAKLSASQASQPIAGSSIAAHLHHVTFGLGASAGWISGDRSSRDWQESWRVKAVDEAAWSQLQQELRKGYKELQQAIESHGASSLEAAGGALGALAHIAYHLGAIRQKVACVGMAR
jgi:hypothetical protein